MSGRGGRGPDDRKLFNVVESRPNLWQEARALATANGETGSDVVNRALQEYVAPEEAELSAAALARRIRADLARLARLAQK